MTVRQNVAHPIDKPRFVRASALEGCRTRGQEKDGVKAAFLPYDLVRSRSFGSTAAIASAMSLHDRRDPGSHIPENHDVPESRDARRGIRHNNRILLFEFNRRIRLLSCFNGPGSVYLYI